MTDRKMLMDQIQAADLAVLEVALYLDTRQNDEKALAYYRTCQTMRNKAMAEYEKMYGPLTIFGNESTTKWKWTDEPWPWELEEQTMWTYEKMLQYPVKIKNTSPAMARLIITQLGGPDGELGASTRYLNQRFAMPYREAAGVLTDIGTEELGHAEMIGTIVYQLTRDLTPEKIKEGGFDAYFVDHTTGIYPQSAAGVPFSAASLQSVGDPIADLTEDLAAEQKARVTYDNLIRLADDPDVLDALRFLREREVVHFQRFGETLRVVQDNLNPKNFYAYNPAFD